MQLSQEVQQKSKSCCWTLENITEKSNGIPTPAAIVVGEVVKLREDLKWFEEV